MNEYQEALVTIPSLWRDNEVALQEWEVAIALAREAGHHLSLGDYEGCAAAWQKADAAARRAGAAAGCPPVELMNGGRLAARGIDDARRELRSILEEVRNHQE